MDITTDNRTKLKSYFEAGDIPTSQQFASLIDAMVNKMDDGIAKITGAPLSIQSELDASVLDFYHNFSDKIQTWRIGLKGTNDSGFNIMDKTNSSRFYIDESTGNIGIGNDNPQVELDVTGSIAASGNIKAQSLSITTGSISNGVFINASGFLSVGAAIDPSSKLYVAGNIKAQTLSITAGTGVTINSSGFMGIGTAPDASSKLYVAGDIKGQSLTLNSGVNGVTINSTGYVGIGVAPDPVSKFYVNGDIKAKSLTINSGTSGVTIDTLGKIGIGAAPDATSKLYVNGDIEINTANSLITSSIKGAGGTNLISFDSKGVNILNYLNFPYGYGMNTTTTFGPGLKIYSNSLVSLPVSSDNASYGDLNIFSGSNTANNGMYQVALFSKGKVNLYGDLNVSPGGGGLGNITYAGIIAKASYIRMKENIVALDDMLQKLDDIRGVYYNWKDKKRNEGKREIGFIAQELEKHYPELVHEDDEGFKRVDYVSFSAILLQAVKELNSKVEALQEKILQTAQ